MTQTMRTARRLPPWLSVVLVLAALGGGAYVAWWCFTTLPRGGEVVVLDKGPEDGIKALMEGKIWRVQAGNTGMRVTRGKDQQFAATFYLLHYEFLSPKEFAVLNSGRRIAMDGAVAADLGLNAKQVDDLRTNVRRGFNLEFPEADRRRVLKLFGDWLDASPSSRPKRELALLRALDEAGDRATMNSRQTVISSVNQIQSSLSAEQWKKFNDMGL